MVHVGTWTTRARGLYFIYEENMVTVKYIYIPVAASLKYV